MGHIQRWGKSRQGSGIGTWTPKNLPVPDGRRCLEVIAGKLPSAGKACCYSASAAVCSFAWATPHPNDAWLSPATSSLAPSPPSLAASLPPLPPSLCMPSSYHRVPFQSENFTSLPIVLLRRSDCPKGRRKTRETDCRSEKAAFFCPLRRV